MALFRETRVFLRQFFRQYHTTGSVLPSSRALAKALCRYVDYKAARELSNGKPAAYGGRQILEVGPGTGAVTARLVTALRPEDRLTLCELNDDFVRHLQKRFVTESKFMAVADRTQIEHKRLEDLPGQQCYDVIISGLPLNNFEVHEVEQILEIFGRLLKPGGTLSFFEYIAIRKAKSLVTSRAGRARLQGIGKALGRILSGREIKRDWVWPNVPPAWVHHVRMGTPQV
jgi:phosphatidylethanolamine/phosphatidyl-N-methylethanolamine N-methyltransferase